MASRQSALSKGLQEQGNLSASFLITAQESLSSGAQGNRSQTAGRTPRRGSASYETAEFTPALSYFRQLLDHGTHLHNAGALNP